MSLYAVLEDLVHLELMCWDVVKASNQDCAAGSEILEVDSPSPAPPQQEVRQKQASNQTKWQVDVDRSDHIRESCEAQDAQSKRWRQGQGHPKLTPQTPVEGKTTNTTRQGEQSKKTNHDGILLCWYHHRCEESLSFLGGLDEQTTPDVRRQKAPTVLDNEGSVLMVYWILWLHETPRQRDNKTFHRCDQSWAMSSDRFCL
jgi:hypothetical protein